MQVPVYSQKDMYSDGGQKHGEASLPEACPKKQCSTFYSLDKI
jgi:hypothetical protein